MAAVLDILHVFELFVLDFCHIFVMEIWCPPPPHAKHHQSFFACSNTTPHCCRSFFIMKHTEKPAHTLLRKDPPTRLLVHHPGPPHASHVPRKQGARHWAPTSSCPSFYPCTSVPSIISAPPLPRVPIMSLQRQQAKEKKRQKRREEYSRYHAEQCWPKYRLLSRALPLLAWSLLKTHPLLPGNNSPTAGGMELGVCCCLKEYSSGPAMAPWSPADRTCWAVKRGRPGPPLVFTGTPSGGQWRPPNRWLRGPKAQMHHALLIRSHRRTERLR